jgi:hypothetical protein
MAIVARGPKAGAARKPKRPLRREKPSDPTPDPLAAVEYTGNLEEDSRRELTALEQGYRERAANEQKRFIAATDSEHWFAVSFPSRADKERFLRAIGLTGRAAPDKYMTGDQLAAALGIDY